MFQSIWNDIKHQFNTGNMLIRIIFVNVGVFVLMVLINLLLGIFVDFSTPSPTFRDKVLPWLALNSDWLWNLTHPWVFITSMFLHIEFFHLLFNMLLLYWFGRIVGDLLGDKRMLPIYLLSGLAGGLVYFLAANISTPFAIGGLALGASAAVLGVLVAAGVTAPDYQIRLLFLGTVRLKYIVATLLVIDLVALSFNNNSGGHLAHLGGALMGYIFVSQLRQGNDWSIPLNRFFDRIGNLFSRQSPPRQPTPKRKKATATIRTMRSRVKGKGSVAPGDDALSHEEQLNAILDKIKRKGIDSLSPEEKDFLLKASKDD